MSYSQNQYGQDSYYQSHNQQKYESSNDGYGAYQEQGFQGYGQQYGNPSHGAMQAQAGFVSAPQPSEFVTLPRADPYNQAYKPNPPSPVHSQHPLYPVQDLKEKKVIEDFDSEFGGKKKKFMYCCIPIQKKARYICFGVTAFIMIILGVVGFLFFPRMPSFQVLSIDRLGNNSYSLTNFDANNPNSFKFSMDMVMNISVLNSNWYHLKVDQITFTVSRLFS